MIGYDNTNDLMFLTKKVGDVLNEIGKVTGASKAWESGCILVDIKNAQENLKKIEQTENQSWINLNDDGARQMQKTLDKAQINMKTKWGKKITEEIQEQINELNQHVESNKAVNNGSYYEITGGYNLSN